MLDIKKLNQIISQENTSNWGTHMPCVFYTKSNVPNLIFCKKINNIWKLHFYNNKKVYRINTGSADNVYECNPNMYYDEKILKYVFTWIVQQPDNTRIIKKCVIDDLKQLYGKTPLEIVDDNHAEYGLINSKYRAYAYTRTGNTIWFKKNSNINKSENESKHIFKLELNFYILARINSIYGADNKIIISVYHPNLTKNTGRTFIIDIQTKEVLQLKLKNGIYPYKAAIDSFTGYIYYTKCKSKVFEDRQLDVTTDWELVPVKEQIFVFKK